MTNPDGPAQERADERQLDLLDALEGERAEARHWRQVARQRAAALTALRRRSSVRALLALERRTEPLRHRLAASRDRLTRWLDRGAVAARALPTRRQLTDRRARLASALDRLPPSPPRAHSISIVMVTDQPIAVDPRAHNDEATELVVVRTAIDAAEFSFADRVIDGTALQPVAAASLGADTAAGELLCFFAATTEPLENGWLDRLAAEIGDGTAAATPLLVQPEHPLSRATPHDLLVRTVGLDLDVTVDGVPIARSREEGTEVSPQKPAVEVAAGSHACLLVDRHAYDDAGGFEPLPDLDVAAFDLCRRLLAAGRRVVVVPSSIAVDHRPTMSVEELTIPINPDGPGWRTMIERHGPALVRSTRNSESEPLSFALTVSAPSTKIAHRWGDWHLAHALGRSLRRLGRRVIVQTADHANSLAGRSCDVHVVLHGLTPVRRTPGQRHVLWIISHPEQVDVDECDEADLLLVASQRFATELRTRTSTPVEVLLQATDHRRFRPLPPDPAHTRPVVVVAKTRDVLRPAVADALAVGLRPAIYGSGWESFVDPDLIVSDYVANEDLPVVYSSAGVLLNDHWDTMRAWGFVSNRLFDALACGTPVISDDLPEITELFGSAVPTYRHPEELRTLVDAAVSDPDAAHKRADAGRETVLASHTFDHRASEMLGALARRGIDSPPS